LNQSYRFLRLLQRLFLQNTAVRNIIKMSIDPLFSSTYIGSGRINARKALEFETPPTLNANISQPKTRTIFYPDPNKDDRILAELHSERYKVFMGKSAYVDETWKILDSGGYKNTPPNEPAEIGSVDPMYQSPGKYSIVLRVYDNSNYYLDDRISVEFFGGLVSSSRRSIAPAPVPAAPLSTPLSTMSVGNEQTTPSETQNETKTEVFII